MSTFRISKHFVLLAGLILASALCFAKPADFRPDEILVKLKPGVSAQEVGRLHGMTPDKFIPRINVHCFRLPPGLSVDRAAQLLNKNPNVLLASPNHILRAVYIPEDEWFDWFQWGFYNPPYRCDVHGPEAWDLETGSEDTIIAIVDTGIDSEHPDLMDKVIPGYNAIDGSWDTEDDFFHGTFVAGIAGASTDNFEGIAGMDWNARLMPIKVLDATGYGDEADAAEGIMWAVDHGAKIINLSLGTYLQVPVLESAVNEAWNAGCVIACASGNDDTDDRVEPHYPSYYPATISVGATNEYDERCTEWDWGYGGSNYGDSLDVMAPGNWVFSTVPTWFETLLEVPYEFMSGTSASAPFVCGLAGLIWAAHPAWTNQQIRDQIEKTCDDLDLYGTGWDRYTGWGRINAFRALDEAFDDYQNISDLRDLPDGASIALPEKPVIAGTAEFSDRFYIEEPDRSSGIMVYYGSQVTVPTSIGDLAKVSGRLSVIDGHRALISPRVSASTGPTYLTPLGMSNKSLGGSLTGYGGVTGGLGLVNSGLLVKTWGKVLSHGWNYFYIDDGCRLEDGSGLLGLKVNCGSLSKPSIGRYVGVTGVSAVEVPTGTQIRIRMLKVRQQSDMVQIN